MVHMPVSLRHGNPAVLNTLAFRGLSLAWDLNRNCQCVSDPLRDKEQLLRAVFDERPGGLEVRL